MDFLISEAIFAGLSGTVGQPSLLGCDALMVCRGLKGHYFGEFAGRNNIRPLFLLSGFFC